jgi:phosphate acetyltransferase
MKNTDWGLDIRGAGCYESAFCFLKPEFNSKGMKMSRSEFIHGVIEAARSANRMVVLPEGADERVLEASLIITREQIARLTVLGDAEKINAWYADRSADCSGITVVDPRTDPRRAEYARQFYEMRKSKGVTEAQALETVGQVNYFGMMIMHNGEADGLVSGAAHSTADTVRPALQIIKSAQKGGMVSSLFFMVCGGVPYIFSDCGLVENPDAAQLARIAVQSAQTARQFNIPAQVAMLSYSTKGSAKSPLVDKVVEATALAKELLATELPGLGIELDGEFQLDAAIVPAIGASKAPGSASAGKARVLIFPDLNAGNICYKAVQRLGGEEAYGPVLQGLAKPVNDLSRGCSAEDIVGVAAITAVQSLN